jgi:hypothetical protein
MLSRCDGEAVTEAEKFLAERGLDISEMRDSYMNPFELEHFASRREIRAQHIHRFGFAVLTGEVIGAIAPYQPLLEVGCGSGYWSYELRQAGLNVIATDPGTGRYVFNEKDRGHWATPWIEIERICGVEAVRKYPARNLLTVWPDLDSSWPAETLKAFQGEIVLYGGEGQGGCTADDDFHSLLEQQFTLVETIRLPQFDGIHDDLEIWRRIHGARTEAKP